MFYGYENMKDFIYLIVVLFPGIFEFLFCQKCVGTMVIIYYICLFAHFWEVSKLQDDNTKKQQEIDNLRIKLYLEKKFKGKIPL